MLVLSILRSVRLYPSNNTMFWNASVTTLDKNWSNLLVQCSKAGLQMFNVYSNRSRRQTMSCQHSWSPMITMAQEKFPCSFWTLSLRHSNNGKNCIVFSRQLFIFSSGKHPLNTSVMFLKPSQIWHWLPDYSSIP